MAPCTTPTEAAQQFTYNSASRQILGGTGRCLTASSAPGPAPGPAGAATLIIGRPLAGGDHVLLFLNNEDSAAKLACDAACMAKLGVVGTVGVRDVWTHRSVGTATAADGWSQDVPSNGGTVMLRLSPTKSSAY
jgi:hypothetical protein